MSTADLLILGLVLLCAGLIIWRMVLNKRRGRHSCSGCAGCSARGSCPSAAPHGE